jgi:hypothetical protein
MELCQEATMDVGRRWGVHTYMHACVSVGDGDPTSTGWLRGEKVSAAASRLKSLLPGVPLLPGTMPASTI